jgi:hypothetical protein
MPSRGAGRRADDTLRALGYTAARRVGKLLAQALFGEALEMQSFPVERLTEREAA